MGDGGKGSGQPAARSLKRNFGSALIGNLAYTLSQFGMLVALARMTDVARVGEYALALALTGPVFVFLGLRLRQVQVTDAIGRHHPSDFVALRLVTSGIGLALAAVIAAVYPTSGEAKLAIFAVAVFKAVESQVDVYYGALQRREQMHSIARSQLVRAIGGLLVFAGALFLWRSVPVAVLALSIFTLMPLAVTMAQVKRLGVPIGPHSDMAALRGLTILALPLGASVVVGALTVTVPRLMIDAYRGPSELGVFAVLSYALVATGTVVASLGEAASPRLANLAVAKEGVRFMATLRRMSLVGALLGAGGVLFAVVAGRFFLDLVFGPQFADGWIVLVALMGAATIQYATVFLGTAVNALRMFTVQLPISLIGLVTLTVTGWVAIPVWGLMGAATAIGCSQIVMTGMYVVLLRRRVIPALSIGLRSAP